ncbi:Scopoletin glucosyltransferase [Spatholobus suberectus]|nr:Scopoletin glucosyltransferase [Spatholobus suberectus]
MHFAPVNIDRWNYGCYSKRVEEPSARQQCRGASVDRRPVACASQRLRWCSMAGLNGTHEFCNSIGSSTKENDLPRYGASLVVRCEIHASISGRDLHKEESREKSKKGKGCSRCRQSHFEVSATTMGAIYLQERPLKLHFIPYPAPGHMIPLCDIATLFASSGHHVTIITTPSNAQILHKPISSHRHLHLHTVRFPSREVGLPDGVENLSAVSDLVNTARVHQATALLRGPIENLVEQHSPDCIVADFLFPWVDDVAVKLHIPRLAFNGFSLFAVCAMEKLRSNSIAGSEYSSFIPNLPHAITLNAAPPKMLTKFMEPLLEAELKSYGLIVNNFAELDGEEYIEHYEKTAGHKAWHIGPCSLICKRSVQEKAERGQKSVVGADECLSWLNSKRVNSVVYICFGSLCQFPDKQLYEIACAIEASGHEFIWVVPEKKGKERESEEEKEKWLPKALPLVLLKLADWLEM